MWAWFWNHCVNFCISPFPRSGTSPWIPSTPSQSQDRNLNAEEPLKPALLHLPAPSLSLFQEHQCLPSLAHTLPPCASVIDAAGDAAPAARGRYCRHADGGAQPLRGCQVAACQPRHSMVATAKPAGFSLFQLVQKLPGSLHSKNFKAFGAIIYAMCFSVFTT